jgi:hypothetical protein
VFALEKLSAVMMPPGALPFVVALGFIVVFRLAAGDIFS